MATLKRKYLESIVRLRKAGIVSRRSSAEDRFYDYLVQRGRFGFLRWHSGLSPTPKRLIPVQVLSEKCLSSACCIVTIYGGLLHSIGCEMWLTEPTGNTTPNCKRCKLRRDVFQAKAQAAQWMPQAAQIQLDISRECPAPYDNLTDE